ncbi:MAG: DUF975 family protein [Oscillospiraceae bacterium]|nr:DUF975 family protein [Oscillospiraceae bacterium]
MKTRRELKLRAKERMQAQRPTAILLVLLVCIKILALFIIDAIALRGLGRIPFVLLYWIGILALLIIAVSLMREFIAIYRGESAKVGTFYAGLEHNWTRWLGGMLWMVLWVAIWVLIAIPLTVLAVFLVKHLGRSALAWIVPLMAITHIAALIPALIKGLSYSMTPFILADQPHVPARAALKHSMQMMHGRKKEYFVLALSFIGWMVLSVLTFGILYVVYVGPYLYTTYAGFYDEVRGAAPEAQAETDGEIEAEIKIEIIEEENTDDAE